MSIPKFLLPALGLASAMTSTAGPSSIFNVAEGAWEDLGSWTGGVPGPTSATLLSNGGVARLNGNATIFGLNVTASGGTIQGISGVRTLGVVGNSASTLGDLAGTTTLTLDSAVVNRSAGSTVLQLGTLSLINGGGFSSDQAVTLSTATSSRSVTGTGAFSLSAGSGVAQVSGGDMSFSVGGSVAFTLARTLQIAEGTFDAATSASSVSGGVDFGAATGGMFRNSGTMALGNLAVTSSTPGGLDFFENAPGAVMNQGAGNSLSFGGSGYSIINGGTLNLGAGGSVTIDPGLALNSGGILNFNGLASLVNDGTLTAYGLVTGSLMASSGAGPVTLGGAVMPGGDGVVGSMGFSSAGTLAINGLLTIDILGAEADLISGGGITLGGESTLALSGSGPGPAGTFSILSGTSLGGHFSNVSEGGVLGGFTVSYTGTGVTLTAVPEPQSYAAVVGLGLLGFTVWRQTRKPALS